MTNEPNYYNKKIKQTAIRIEVLVKKLQFLIEERDVSMKKHGDFQKKSDKHKRFAQT